MAAAPTIHHEHQKLNVDMDQGEASLELLKMQLFSLTEVDPELQLLVGSGGVLESDQQLAAALAADSNLVLLQANRAACIVDDGCGSQRLDQARANDGTPVVEHPVPGSMAPAAPAELQMRQQIMQSRVGAAAPLLASEPPQAVAESRQILGRIMGSMRQFRQYERPSTVAKALRTVPVARLWQEAQAQAEEQGGNHGPARHRFRDLLLRHLAKWFKHSFFKWVNNPPCASCGNQGTKLVGRAAPTEEERVTGGAGIVEVYKCNACQASTRFARLNNPEALLDSRRGRCGEWANTFCAVASALGFQCRFVNDWTDHVWVEVYSEGQRKWLHVDACENAVDAPLMYERGWGKKLSYIFAVGRDHVADVARRYTAQFHRNGGTLSRRDKVPEPWLRAAVAALSDFQRATATTPTVTDARLAYLRERQMLESVHLAAGTEALWSLRDLKPGELRGRISGSFQWRLSRAR